MFAAALAHNMSIDLDNIRHGLRTFDTTFFQAPGRLNVYDELPFKVIMDYAHNPAAVKTICDVVDRFEIPGRKIVVLAMPGDRRDEDIQEVAGIAAGHFDHYICRRDDNHRGRGPSEVPEILATALGEAGIEKHRIQLVPDEQEANLTALQMSRTGDLLLILADSIARSWKQIIYFKPGEEVVADQTRPAVVEIPPDVIGSFEIDDNMELIRDERGVRIARETED
jgi:cyanophycin synthetase